MDRGTDAKNLLLGKVIPLRLDNMGFVKRSDELSFRGRRSIKDALVAEEKFFRSHPVYNALADRCGIPQLAKKLNRSGQGALLLNILSKYSQAFCSMVEGKKDEMSITELFGGARIHYIFQSIFAKSLEMDYINTSHPNFIGGSNALEIAVQQTKSSRLTLQASRRKDGTEAEKGSTSERTMMNRVSLPRQVNGVVNDQVVQNAADVEKVASSANGGGTSWGISLIFGGGGDNRLSNIQETSTSKLHSEPVQNMGHSFSMIQLREVNHTKRELHNVLIKRLYRENLFEELLQEPDEISIERKRTRDTLRLLQQALRTLEELPLQAETVERGYSSTDSTGLPRVHGLPTSSYYSLNDSGDFYSASPHHFKSRKSHSGELQSPRHTHADSNGNGRPYMPGLYPVVDA